MPKLENQTIELGSLTCVGIWQVDAYKVHVFVEVNQEPQLEKMPVIVTQDMETEEGIFENVIVLSKKAYTKVSIDSETMDCFVHDFFLGSLAQLGEIKPS